MCGVCLGVCRKPLTGVIMTILNYTFGGALTAVVIFMLPLQNFTHIYVLLKIMNILPSSCVAAATYTWHA